MTDNNKPTPKIEGVVPPKKDTTKPRHPNVIKRDEQTQKYRDNQQLKKRKNRSIAHIKPIIKAEIMTMLTKCMPKIEIVKNIKDSYGVGKTSINTMIEDCVQEISKIGKEKVNNAQRNAIGEMELTKTLLGKYVESVDEDGNVKLDKDAMRLFLDAQKRQHAILGLDKVTLDLTVTGAESHSDAELEDIIINGKTDTIEETKLIESDQGEGGSDEGDTPLKGK